MTQKEILELEKGNLDRIFLFSEGMFWKAYERSAFNFVTNVKPFRPTRKNIAAAGCDVISIGFPMTGLAGLIPDERIVERTDKTIAARADEITDEDFIRWKESVALTQPAVKSKAEEESAVVQAAASVEVTAGVSAQTPDVVPNGRECLCRELSRMLIAFDIAGKTPMECMLLVAEMKKMITNP